MNRNSRSPSAVSASLTRLLGAYADEHGQLVNTVRRRFVISRFLARVVDADPDGWVLKGGISMMVRLPEARHSKDIDLLDRRGTDGAIEDLRRIVRDNHLDQFRFDVENQRRLANGKGITVSVTARLGAKTFDKFSIDIVSPQRPLVGNIERRRLPRIIDTDDFTVEAEILLYPIEDQIADKICALYEHFGTSSTVSGRYRDLVDLLLISWFMPIDLGKASEALERERALRGIATLPPKLESPGPTWTRQWPRTAREALPREYDNLDYALEEAERCYGVILASLPSAQASATWNPTDHSWHYAPDR